MKKKLGRQWMNNNIKEYIIIAKDGKNEYQIM